MPPLELEACLDGVERALRSLDDGTYGICDACGGPIPEDTLEADPTASLCVEHQGGLCP